MSNSLNDYYAERIAQEAARRLEEMANVTDSQTNGITLLPCPFCGGEAEIHPSNDWDVRFTGATYFAWCDKCETRGDYYSTEAEAAESWNTRAERTCVNDGTIKWDWDKCEPYWQHELSCGHVVTTMEPEPPRYCEECGARVVDR